MCELINVCMFVCTKERIYEIIFVRMYGRIYVCMYVCMNESVYVCTYICMYYKRMYISTCVNMCYIRLCKHV